VTKGWAVVTGASSGIGLAFATEPCRLEYSVLAVARRRDRLVHGRGDGQPEYKDVRATVGNRLVLTPRSAAKLRLKSACPIDLCILESRIRNRRAGLLRSCSDSLLNIPYAGFGKTDPCATEHDEETYLCYYESRMSAQTFSGGLLTVLPGKLAVRGNQGGQCAVCDSCKASICKVLR